MKKTTIVSLALTLALLLLVGCGFSAVTEAEGPGGTRPDFVSGATPDADAPDTVTAEPLAAVEVDSSVSKRDASGEFDAAGATALSPDGELTITEEGVYLLSGSYEGMIVVDAGDEAKVQLVLQNAALVNEDGPAIYVRSADKVFLTAAEGTVNTISDGTDYALTDGDTTLDAAVFSRDDLTINGAGKLTINGNYKHAVVSKDDLVVTASALSIKAENVGLNGKDSVKLSGATVVITAGSDGIRSDNGTDEGKGFVSVVDSALTINAAKDGIQAETAFVAGNAQIRVITESGKGVKAGVSLTVDGGELELETKDDALHTNGSLLISGGSFSIRSGDDGVHADEKAEISGGEISITAREGIEATVVRISGGEISITASDDGINAARKSAAYTPAVEISGGTVTITMGAGDTDGIDSNGSILISGGTVSVNGQSSFDYDGSGEITGGTVYVNGEQVTTLPNQFMGGAPGGMGGFGGFGGQGRPDGGQGGFGGGRGGFGGGRGGQA